MKEALLKAATNLFARYGFEKVTIKLIAEEAGMTSGMISYYFGGKRGLYRSVLQSLFSSYEQGLSQVAIDETRDCATLIKKYFKTARSIYEENPAFSTIICREGAEPSEDFRLLLREHEERMGGDYLKKLVEHCIGRGAIRSGHSAHILARILSLNANYYRIPASLHSVLHPETEFDIGLYFDTLTDLFLAMLEKES